MTNGDRIRSMNDEELAGFILGIDIDRCSGSTMIWSDKYNSDIVCETEEDVLDWVKEEE